MTPPNYDTSETGAYFVTMVTRKRADLFGGMKGNVMRMNTLGEAIRAEWEQMGTIRPEIKVDQYVLMPNHMHAIVFIHLKETAEVDHEKVLHAVIGRFRKNSETRAGQLWGQGPIALWERNYYERAIRNASELQAFRDYIVYNPLRWRWEEAHLK